MKITWIWQIQKSLRTNNTKNIKWQTKNKMRSRNWVWLFSKKFRGYLLMYCFGGNHRYRLVGRFGGNLGGNLWGNLENILGGNLWGNIWGNLWGNLGCKIWTEIIFFKKCFFGIPNLDKLMIFIKWDYLVCLYILENLEFDNRDTKFEKEA